VLTVAAITLGFFSWKPIYIEASNEAILLYKEKSESKAAILKPEDFAYEWLHKAFSDLKKGRGGEHAAQLKNVLGVKDDKILIDAYLNYPHDCATVGSSQLVQIGGTMLDISKSKMPEMKVIFQLTVSHRYGKYELEHLGINPIGQENQLRQFAGALCKSGPGDVVERNKRTLKLARISRAWSEFNIDRSHQEMKRAMELNPECSYLYYFDGTSYLEEGDNLAALAQFDKCLKLAPGNAFALVNRAQAKEKLKDFAGSVYDTNEAIQKNPKNFYAQINRGSDQCSYSNYEEAIKNYNAAIEVDPTNRIALVNRAECFEALNEKDNALLDYGFVAKFYPDDYSAYLKRGKLLSDMRQNHEAIQTLEKANLLCPKDEEHKKDLMKIYNELSYGYSKVKFEAMAFSYAEKQIKLDPDDARGYADRAFSYWNWNQIDKALTDMEKAISLRTDRSSLHNIVSKLKMENNDFNGALAASDEALRRAIESNSDEIAIDVLKTRAKIKKKLGDLEGSKKDLDNATTYPLWQS